MTCSYITAQSQRDDLESLVYVLASLENGVLPWEDRLVPRPNPNPYSCIWQRKERTTTSELFQGMEPVYTWFMREVKVLAFGEVPDYEGMRRAFAEAWKRRGFGGVPGVLDWREVGKALRERRPIEVGGEGEEGTEGRPPGLDSLETSTMPEQEKELQVIDVTEELMRDAEKQACSEGLNGMEVLTFDIKLDVRTSIPSRSASISD